MPYNIFQFVPAFGQMVSATTFMTTHALQQALAAKGIGGGISTLSFPDIAELRSMALTIWHDTMPNATHLLFIDADMGFAPDTVLDMLLFDEPVIGAIYPQRKIPLSWAGSGTGTPTTERRGNFMEVEGVGMGCTLIRRDVVNVMLEKFPELIDTRLNLHPAGETIRQAGANRLLRLFEKMDIPERGVVSEDLSFCIRWRQCGGKVWASIGHKMSHVGPFDYSGRYLDVVEAQMAAQGGQVQPPAPLMVTNGGSTTAEEIKIVASAEPVEKPAEIAKPTVIDSAAWTGKAGSNSGHAPIAASDNPGHMWVS